MPDLPLKSTLSTFTPADMNNPTDALPRVVPFQISLRLGHHALNHITAAKLEQNSPMFGVTYVVSKVRKGGGYYDGRVFQRCTNTVPVSC